MKKKILITISGHVYFCLAKIIKEKYDCDLFAFCDIDYKPKKFFKKQKIFPIKKTWYYDDEVLSNLKQKPNLDFLKSFEKKYQIDLWRLVYMERWFYKYNQYHTFTHDEILSILEQECKLFEAILDETKPDFLIMDNQSSHHNRLLEKMCLSREIIVLRHEYARLIYRSRIAAYSKKPIKETTPLSPSLQTISPKELPKILEEFGNMKQINFVKKQKINRTSQISSTLKFLLKPMDKEYNDTISRVEKTKYKFIKNIMKSSIRKRLTRSFVNHNSVHNLDVEMPFIYFPLHQEPEMSLLIDAPYFTNQTDVIYNIAKSLPLGYQLLVKDHPLAREGERTISFYKDLMNLPNVKVVHPSISRNEIIEKCSLVITINGSAGFEAGFFGKPSIVLVKNDYSTMPNVYQINTISELPNAIRTCLRKNIDLEEICKYVEQIFAHTFEFDGYTMQINGINRFYTIGFEYQMNEVTESEIKSFMKENNYNLNILADEIITKIQHLTKY